MRSRGFPALLVLALIIGLIVLVERLIVTDAEAVEAVVEQAADAVKQGDFAALADLLDMDYKGEGGDKDGAIAYAQRIWGQWRPMGLRAAVGQVEVNGDEASAPTMVRGQVLGRPFGIRVGFGLKRTDDGWRISSAQYLGMGL
jgi:ketosteroid isomerase-like protein